LIKWNVRIRLVGDAADAERHLADSQAVLPFIPRDCRRLVDVGAGAGFPSVIIAVERPGLHVVALEPVHKKHAFLASVRRELALPNFEPRAERDDQHVELPTFQPYDVAISRATFPVPVWLERGRQLVRAGGLVLALEGRRRHDLAAGAVRHDLQIPGRDAAIIVYETARISPSD
jgi:16S rRNA (guanine527-N7)-methyltransferase